MRPHVPAVLLALVLAGCGLPPNAPSAYGVAAYDTRTGDFWVNGKPYYIPPGVSTNAVRSGDQVNVLYEQQGDRRVVTRIDVVDRFVFGMI